MSETFRFLNVAHGLHDDVLYSEAETAIFSGRSKSSLAKDRCLGRGLPFHKIFAAVKYRGSDIRKFVEATRVDPAAKTVDSALPPSHDVVT